MNPVTSALETLSTRLAQIKAGLQQDLSGIRSNRANPELVAGVEVEVYGSKMKLRDLAHISAPESRLIVVQPWDGSQVETIAKGLSAASLGITPSVDGGLIRLPLPPLTEERREELVKLVRGKLEEAKISSRSARHEALVALERAKEDKSITEDELERGKTLFQKEVDQVTVELETAASAKESEVRSV
jgi:ribosome recycling factor